MYHMYFHDDHLEIKLIVLYCIVSRGGGGVVFELSAWPGGDHGVCSNKLASVFSRPMCELHPHEVSEVEGICLHGM